MKFASSVYLQKLWHTIQGVFEITSRAISLLLAPPFCAYCGIFLSESEVFCSTCFTKIVPIASHTVSLTARKKMVVHAIGIYEQPLKTLILAKLNGAISASRQLGELMAQKPPCVLDGFDYLVPIPLHWMRFASRGFNQAEEIAQVISNISSIPVLCALERVKNTKFQSALHRTQRANNVQNAFAVKKSYQHLLQGKKILLIDDLFTSGATLYAAGRTLLPCKPEIISGFVASRAV